MTTLSNRMIETHPASRPDPDLESFEHRFATVDGVRLHYVAGGKLDGETVVLLAGFPESWYAWRKIMPQLSVDYRIIAPDLPGQGDSDHPASGYDTEALANSIHGLLGQLGIGRHVLVAHDVGAWVAFPYAALFGCELRGLVLMDAGIPGITLPDALSTAPARAWRTWHFAFHTIPDLPESLITGREREYLDWFLRRKAANPETFADVDLDEYLRVFKKDGGLRAGLAYYPGRCTICRAEPNAGREGQACDARAGPRFRPGLHPRYGWPVAGRCRGRAGRVHRVLWAFPSRGATQRGGRRAPGLPSRGLSRGEASRCGFTSWPSRRSCLGICSYPRRRASGANPSPGRLIAVIDLLARQHVTRFAWSFSGSAWLAWGPADPL